MKPAAGKFSRDFWTHLIAAVLVRLVYFLGMAFFLIFAALGVGSSGPVNPFHSTGLLFTLAVSTASAVFGPGIYRRYISRGRGSLGDVKEKSRNG